MEWILGQNNNSDMPFSQFPSLKWVVDCYNKSRPKRQGVQLRITVFYSSAFWKRGTEWLEAKPGSVEQKQPGLNWSLAIKKAQVQNTSRYLHCFVSFLRL